MAKRRDGGDAALNLDSLMDTVTNVVGVLMIVLIMVSLNIATSINKILSDLPPVTPEQFQELKEKVTQELPKEDPKKLEEEIKLAQEKVKKSDEELKTLDTTTSQNPSLKIDLEEIRARLDKNKKMRDERKLIVDNKIQELESLKAKLDTTPVYVPPPATVVKLPNPRPIPENAVYQRFLVVGDRIVYLNATEFLRVVSEEVGKQKNLTFPNPIKNSFGEVIMAGGKPKEYLDRKRVMAFFADRLRLSTRDLKIELDGNPNSPRLNLRFTMQENGGENLAAIKQPGSVFQRAMRKFGGEPNTVVWFHVYKDAIGTYLAARDIADEANVACGWEISGNPYYQIQIPSFEVDFVPAKPQPPPPPGTVTIPAPKKTLD